MIDTFEVYVQLLDEGTPVWRPTSATRVAPDIVRLLAPTNYAPDDEHWEFEPGSLVQIERRVLSAGEAWVAVSRAGP